MKEVNIAVIGGGITGQLIKHAMPSATVYDWKAPPTGDQRKLTRSFGANYLWERIGGIPCREFKVITHIDGRPATLDGIIDYKRKIGKNYEVPEYNGGLSPQFTPETWGLEFTDFPKVDINYGYRITQIDRLDHTIHFADKPAIRYQSLMSTIPLYSLLSLLGMPEPTGRLKYDPIYLKVMSPTPDARYDTRSGEVMYVNYLSDSDIVPYRYCDREGERHYESIVPYRGVTQSRRLIPGKIHPHPGAREMRELLEGFDIYTFGRYGKWAPDELVHQTWRDIIGWSDNYEENV